jgi:DNA-binding GntR family transcriptional regulator
MTGEPGQLNHINNKSLREQVVAVLRDAILQGDFKPGQSLVETELAAQLGVSRAPLREAIQILNKEGLVETVPYHGTTVRRLHKKDIEELYSLRGLLEAFAISRIITMGNHQTVAGELHTIFEAMLAAADKGDLKKVNSVDRDFHDALISQSNHDLLAATWSGVALRVRQVMALRNRRNSDLKDIAYNHLPIIEAVRDADEARAIDLIKKHVATSGDLMVGAWNDDDDYPGAPE